MPVTIYNPDAGGGSSGGSVHFSIPVTPSPSSTEPSPLEDKITPLRDDVFKSMPRTMQKMSVKDKVIIITGWVRCCRLCARLLANGAM